jgi:hypothetical protein
LSESEQKKEVDGEKARQEREQDRVNRDDERFVARLEHQKTITITQKTVRDTVGMTIVALLYLPSTFVAVGVFNLAK